MKRRAWQAELVADDRTNSVLISGEKSQRLRMKGLVMHLDTPLESGGDTQVRYLNYADAEQIAGQAQGASHRHHAGGAGRAALAQPVAGPAAAQDRNTTIWADKQTNALVVTAAPKMMRQIMGGGGQARHPSRAGSPRSRFWSRSPQSRAAELGVNWAVFSEEQGSTIPIGTFNQPVGGTSIGSIASAIINPDTDSGPPCRCRPA